MITWLKRHIGTLFIATGLIHVISGIVSYYQPVVDMLQSGLFNSIQQQDDRELAFWYFMLGLFIMIVGHMMNWLVRKHGLQLPASVGWYLAMFSLAGIIIMPDSGFWVVILLAWIIIKK